jgi:hypothetical protein
LKYKKWAQAVRFFTVKEFTDVKTTKRSGQTVANRKRGGFEHDASSAPPFSFTYWN